MTVQISKITKEILKEALNNGEKQRDIAKRFGVSESLISKKVKKFGLRRDIVAKYIGKKYGQLKILEFVDRDKHGHMIFDCVCDCGKIIPVKCYSLITNNTKSCGCTARKRGADHACFRGYKEISAVYWGTVTSGSKKRSRVMKFEVTIQDVWDLFIKQNRKCALTGVPIFFHYDKKTKIKLQTASLDRIDSKKDYTLDNIQWVHKTVNRIKWALDQNEFIKFCKLVANYN